EILQRAIKQDDSVAELHAELGYVYAEQKRRDDAKAEFKRALLLAPEWPWTTLGYASKLATDPKPTPGDGPLAVLLAKEACYAFEEKEPGTLDALAAAYAQNGQFDQAVKTAKRALTLCDGSQPADLAPAIRDRIRLYEKNQPFHRKIDE